MVTEKSLIQQGGKLLDEYLRLYQVRYGKRPTVNRYKEKFKMKDVVESVGFTRSLEIMDYYFRTGRTSHPIDWFVYNFDKLHNIMLELSEDEKKKEVLRAQTKARVEEWERRKRESRSEFD